MVIDQVKVMHLWLDHTAGPARRSQPDVTDEACGHLEEFVIRLAAR